MPRRSPVARNFDLNGPEARALRAVQKLDQFSSVEGREYLIEAEDALGELLGLDCTADDPDASPFYSHNGETCLIHEWLVPSDAEEVPDRE
jgi:hypothetical protein